MVHAATALSSILMESPEYAGFARPVPIDFDWLLQELARLEAQFPLFVEREGYRLIDLAGGLLGSSNRADVLTLRFLLEADEKSMDHALEHLNRTVGFMTNPGSDEWPIQEWWEIRQGDSLYSMLVALKAASALFQPLGREFLQACQNNGFGRTFALPSFLLPAGGSRRFVTYLPQPYVLLPIASAIEEQEVAQMDPVRYLDAAISSWPDNGELNRLALRVDSIKQWRKEHRAGEIILEGSTDLAGLAATDAICRLLGLPGETKDIVLIAVLAIIKAGRF
jgi:hypothetical protein